MEYIVNNGQIYDQNYTGVKDFLKQVSALTTSCFSNECLNTDKQRELMKNFCIFTLVKAIGYIANYGLMLICQENIRNIKNSRVNDLLVKLVSHMKEDHKKPAKSWNKPSDLINKPTTNAQNIDPSLIITQSELITDIDTLHICVPHSILRPAESAIPCEETHFETHSSSLTHHEFSPKVKSGIETTKKISDSSINFDKEIASGEKITFSLKIPLVEKQSSVFNKISSKGLEKFDGCPNIDVSSSEKIPEFPSKKVEKMLILNPSLFHLRKYGSPSKRANKVKEISLNLETQICEKESKTMPWGNKLESLVEKIDHEFSSQLKGEFPGISKLTISEFLKFCQIDKKSAEPMKKTFELELKSTLKNKHSHFKSLPETKMDSRTTLIEEISAAFFVALAEPIEISRINNFGKIRNKIYEVSKKNLDLIKNPGEIKDSNVLVYFYRIYQEVTNKRG